MTRGLVTSRRVRGHPGPGRWPARASDPRRLSRLRRSAALAASAAGRWSLVPAVETDLDRDDLAEAVAEQLLNRWGVVFRDRGAPRLDPRSRGATCSGRCAASRIGDWCGAAGS